MGKESHFRKGEHRWAASRWKTAHLCWWSRKCKVRVLGMPCSYSVCWKSDETIIIALENRNYYVNLGTAILVWVSALEKLCARVHRGRWPRNFSAALFMVSKTWRQPRGPCWLNRVALYTGIVILQWKRTPVPKSVWIDRTDVLNDSKTWKKAWLQSCNTWNPANQLCGLGMQRKACKKWESDDYKVRLVVISKGGKERYTGCFWVLVILF